MNNFEELLIFIEELTYTRLGEYLSELQRRILLNSLQGSKKTYEQIATDSGYSAKYLRQDVAPKLWKLLSGVLEQKITKSNVKAVLEHLMRHQPLPASSAEVVLSRSETSVTSNFEKGNILLVDDQPANLKLLSDLLEEQGHEVQQAINGVIALQVIEIEAPDVILLDINMPELDGYTVCQKLKTNPQTQDIPVIFVSALDEAWDKVKAFSVGGSDYITKPYKTVEVLARVENQLKVRHLQFQLQQIQQELQQKDRELQQALEKIEEMTGKKLLE